MGWVGLVCGEFVCCDVMRVGRGLTNYAMAIQSLPFDLIATLFQLQ